MMNNKRLAALKVAQLSKGDRKWLFGQLAIDEKRRLSEQLELLNVSVGKNIADFGSLLSDLDFNVLEAVTDGNDATPSMEGDKNRLALKVEEIDARSLAGVLTEAGEFIVALWSLLYPEIGLKYLPLCPPARARKVRRYMEQIHLPLPESFKQSVEEELETALANVTGDYPWRE